LFLVSFPISARYNLPVISDYIPLIATDAVKRKKIQKKRRKKNNYRYT